MKKFITPFIVLLSVLMLFNCATEEEVKLSDEEMAQCQDVYSVLYGGVLAVQSGAVASANIASRSLVESITVTSPLGGAITANVTKEDEENFRIEMSFNEYKGKTSSGKTVTLTGDINLLLVYRNETDFSWMFNGKIDVTGDYEFSYGLNYSLIYKNNSISYSVKYTMNGKSSTYSFSL